ncbi:MAG: WbqC family protein [Bacteroidales bacterium]|jgi:hypothetical protein|nr:WbqC family protein [Bacteroidales bacterium]
MARSNSLLSRKELASKERVLFFPTCYLPSIAMFYDILLAVDKGIYALDREEIFAKQTFRNRTYILSSQGLQMLTVPVVKKTGQKIKDVRIFNEIHWKQNHWRSLETCYNNSPFFMHYSDEIKRIYDRNFVFLLDLNEEMLDFLFNKIRLKKCNEMSQFENDNSVAYATTFDYNDISPKKISVIDLLFNTGNEANKYFSRCQN